MDLLADTAPGVREGLGGSVSAAWWGFDPEDAKPALQACLESGARTIVIPAMGRPWVTRPLSIRSHTTLVRAARGSADPVEEGRLPEW